MKKIVILVAMLALTAFLVPAFAGAAPATDSLAAQGNAGKTQIERTWPRFVDNNGDGICDNRGTGSNALNGSNGCPGYTDNDGDGVCDNRGTGQNDRSACPAYTDNDGDGVCDNCPSNKRTPRGYGNGNNGYHGGSNGRCGR